MQRSIEDGVGFWDVSPKQRSREKISEGRCRNAIWKAPTNDYFKINFDGAKGQNGKSIIGFFITDCTG